MPLAAVGDPALVATTLLSALKLHDGSARPPQTRLIEHLRRKELLLVLDNFEQLISAASPAVALVAESAGRMPWSAHPRHQPRAAAPACRATLSCSAVGAGGGGRLVCAAVPPRWMPISSLPKRIALTIEAICQQVDRLPLALELCAAQIDLLSLPQLLAGSAGSPAGAAGGRRIGSRPRTITRCAGAIGHSYDLLDEGERRLFRSLGVFVGGCALEAIAAVSAWDQELAGRPLLPTLHALIGKSLVRAETTPGGAARYLLLETIGEFALEQARAEGEEDRLRRRHYAATLQLFRTADSHLRGPESAAWLARLEPEQEICGRPAVGARRRAPCGHGVAAAGRQRGTGSTSVTGMSRAGGSASCCLTARRSTPTCVWRSCSTSMPSAARRRSSQPIDRYTDELLGLMEICPDQLLHSAAWHFIAGYASDFPEATAAWERSIACARAAREAPGAGSRIRHCQADRDFVLGTHLWAYADRLVEHGEFERAAPLLMESAQLFQARGNRYGMADSLGTLGRLALLQGDMVKAGALLHEAVTLASEFNYQEMVGNLQPLLGLVTLYGGDARRRAGC